MRAAKSTAVLWDLGLRTIHELEVDRGILASSRNEVYGCIFGRDSLITALNLLSVYEQTKDPYFLSLVKKIIVNLAELQGTAVNLESGEEPGKCIHEYRPEGHEHLTKHATEPWYVYPDNVMRNYDSVDSTPLLLMTIHRYGELSGDSETVMGLLPNVRRGIHWLTDYADTNGDGLIDYRFHEDRKYGGLRTQSWMDSQESVFHEDGSMPQYPIAPLEVQAYAYNAFRAWSEYFADSDATYAAMLCEKADRLKTRFNNTFVIKPRTGVSLAFAIDGTMRPLQSARSSMAHVFWAARKVGETYDCILDSEHHDAIVQRLMARDLFSARAGLRTLTARSRLYFPNSYHNGSIWPHDTAIAADGLARFGYTEEAGRMRNALVAAYMHFKTPIELFTYDKRKYGEYTHENGGGACRLQAWSAAAMLTTVRGIQN